MKSSALLKVAGPVSAPSPSKEAVIDEFGELDRRVKAFAPTLKRHEELKTTIKSWYVNYPIDQPASAEGQLYILQVTPCENESTANKKAIYRLLSPKLFLDICTVTQKAVKQALESLGKSDQFEKLFSVARTGSRKLSVVLKAPPEAA